MVPLTLLSLLITVLAGYMIWRNTKNEPRSMWLGTWTLVFLFFLLITVMLAASFLGGPGLLVLAGIVLMIIGIFVIASIFIDLGVVTTHGKFGVRNRTPWQICCCHWCSWLWLCSTLLMVS